LRFGLAIIFSAAGYGGAEQYIKSPYKTNEFHCGKDNLNQLILLE